MFGKQIACKKNLFKKIRKMNVRSLIENQKKSCRKILRVFLFCLFFLEKSVFGEKLLRHSGCHSLLYATKTE